VECDIHLAQINQREREAHVAGHLQIDRASLDVEIGAVMAKKKAVASAAISPMNFMDRISFLTAHQT
jgi:hypothetical protein